MVCKSREILVQNYIINFNTFKVTLEQKSIAQTRVPDFFFSLTHVGTYKCMFQFLIHFISKFVVMASRTEVLEYQGSND